MPPKRIASPQPQQGLVFYCIQMQRRAMFDPYFFGYGSLVNRDTHDFDRCHSARLNGWKRAWRHTELRDVAFLTAVPSRGSQIDGLIAAVPLANWAALDDRERAYDRNPVADETDHDLDHQPEVHVYAIPQGKHGQPDSRHPILLSYLDVVVQGYLREFGEDGVTRFFETTDGWDAPVLNDRSNPRYPRYGTLTTDERDLTDQWLQDLSAVVQQL